ncbi:azurin [Wocania ichthyoenteri]|uniref:azurin n=1 Tax=Wocania ichthyoenteri TaxID=1230531 RepID=UPI00053DF1ED|nr:azurin [Wocania ichthyoenteri]
MKFIRIQVLALFSTILLFNCGNKEEKMKKGFTYESTNSQVKSKNSKDEDAVANVVLTSNDLMQFNTKEIKVEVGQKVKLTLRHLGKLDINVMGHNFVLLKSGTDIVAFAIKAANERDNEYIPKDSQDIIAHTNLIGGGQVTIIEFEAPAAGTYQFLCSFPGHYAMMSGKFIVE